MKSSFQRWGLIGLLLAGGAAGRAGSGPMVMNEARLVLDSAAAVGPLVYSDETVVSILPAHIGALPSLQLPGGGRAGVDAVAVSDAYVLFSCDVDVVINGDRYADEDVVVADLIHSNYFGFRIGALYGLPENCDVDALAVSADFDMIHFTGALYFSVDTDIPEWGITDDDVLIWPNVGVPYKWLDGQDDLGIPEEADLDALHVDASNLYYSLDIKASVPGLTPSEQHVVRVSLQTTTTVGVIEFNQIERQANLYALDYPMDRDGDWLTDFEELSGLDEGSTVVPGTTVPLDPNRHVTDPNTPHTDTDGVPDGEEAAAGTNPNDPDDYLQLTAIRQDGSNRVVTWDSVPGRTYDLEALTNFAPSQVQIIADDVTATDWNTTRTNAAARTNYIYRIRLEPR